MNQGKIIPFYMAYPLPLYYEEEREFTKDLEYLQSQHPIEIRTMQKEIQEIINIMDYKGSVIYDEYPDQFSLQRKSADICEQLKRKHKDDVKCPYYRMINWEGFHEIVHLLVYEEIIKRRHCKNKRFLGF